MSGTSLHLAQRAYRGLLHGWLQLVDNRRLGFHEYGRYAEWYLHRREALGLSIRYILGKCSAVSGLSMLWKRIALTQRKRCPNLAVLLLTQPLLAPYFVLYPAVDVVGLSGLATLFWSLPFYAFTGCTFSILHGTADVHE